MTRAVVSMGGKLYADGKEIGDVTSLEMEIPDNSLPEPPAEVTVQMVINEFPKWKPTGRPLAANELSACVMAHLQWESSPFWSMR